MQIDGFGLGGYRSFNAIQRLGPLGRVNLLVGQNNVGKSNVLRFMANHGKSALDLIAQGRGVKDLGLTADDRPDGIPQNRSDLHVEIAIAYDSPRYQNTVEQLPAGAERDALALVLARLSDANGLAWIPFRLREGKAEIPNEFVVAFVSEDRGFRRQLAIASSAVMKRSTAEINNAARELLSWIAARGAENSASVEFVPAIRAVTNTGQPKIQNDHSGLNLVHELARLQNPIRAERKLQNKFDGLNAFLQGVLDRPDAQLEVTHDKTQLLVQLDGLTLPIEDIGTGIHEVVILAAVATVLENHLLCIEEPEIHLHPLLQRKLLVYLVNVTSNNYLVATHSAHLIDASTGALVIHAKRDDGWTSLVSATNSEARVAICQDLGYRASDLLQTNAVIWVEGPSDRVYLRHWLALGDPSLIEGVHYSIMFYGGRLLSHLTAQDDEVTEFINLRRINHNMAILIDCDKTKSGDRLNHTKKRVLEEMGAKPGYAWVTEGREVENYVNSDVLLEAVRDCHPGAVRLQHTGQYDHALTYIDKKSVVNSRVDKVQVARAAVDRGLTLDPYNLRSRIRTLVAFIRTSNGI